MSDGAACNAFATVRCQPAYDGHLFYQRDGLKIGPKAVGFFHGAGRAGHLQLHQFARREPQSPPERLHSGITVDGNTVSETVARDDGDADGVRFFGTGHRITGSSDAPAGIPSITFVGNTCATTGAQAVNLRRWPNVEVRQNRFSGPGLQRAVLIIDGSTGCAVIGNTTAGDVPTVEIDGSSRPGFQQNGNSPA